MKHWRLLLIGVLAAFELGVVYLVFNPNVSERYRAFFLERSTDCWPGDVSGTIEPGRRISFLKADAEGPARHLLLCGWIKAEGTGTWSRGPEARLLLQLPPDARSAAFLDLKLLPFVTPEHPRQRVEISANDIALAELELTKDSSSSVPLEIPPGAIGEDGRVEILFMMPDAVAPRDLGLSTDRRRLGVRLVFATLHLREQ